MMNTNGEAFLINFHDDEDTCELGAAVVVPGGYLAVAGFVGVMPAIVGHKIIDAATSAGVTTQTVVSAPDGAVIALCWGDIDAKKLFGLIAIGIAESATKAVVDALAVAGQPIDHDEDWRYTPDD